MSLYLSRLALSQSPSALALSGILNPAEPGRRLDAHHRLLWAVFGDTPDRRRDFLWREERPGEFLTLSVRAPMPSELFATHEVKPFAPALATGDRLSFALRANATRTRKAQGRVDVVMDALHGLPKGARAEERMVMAQQEGSAWVARQGGKSGFRLIGAEVGDYAVVSLPGYRGPRKGQPQFGILDLTGQIEITDPAAFLVALAAGFGRAKAFGCGLMLIRRA